jgi:hypothetical protein
MTVEEMDAHAAYMDKFNKKLHHDLIADLTEDLARAKDPVEREWLIKQIEGVRAIGNGKYD